MSYLKIFQENINYCTWLPVVNPNEEIFGRKISDGSRNFEIFNEVLNDGGEEFLQFSRSLHA